MCVHRGCAAHTALNTMQACLHFPRRPWPRVWDTTHHWAVLRTRLQQLPRPWSRKGELLGIHCINKVSKYFNVKTKKRWAGWVALLHPLFAQKGIRSLAINRWLYPHLGIAGLERVQFSMWPCTPLSCSRSQRSPRGTLSNAFEKST